MVYLPLWLCNGSCHMWKRATIVIFKGMSVSIALKFNTENYKIISNLKHDTCTETNYKCIHISTISGFKRIQSVLWVFFIKLCCLLNVYTYIWTSYKQTFKPPWAQVHYNHLDYIKSNGRYIFPLLARGRSKHSFLLNII